MKIKFPNLSTTRNSPIMGVQSWTIAIFVTTGIICSLIALLYFQELHTHNRIIQYASSFRQAQVELVKGFVMVIVSADQDMMVEAKAGFALLEQSLTTFEQQTIDLGESLDEINHFRDKLNSFRDALTQLSSREIVVQAWMNLWLEFEHLEEHVKVLDLAMLTNLEAEGNNFRSALGGMLGIALVLFGGVGIGVFYAVYARQQVEIALKQSEARYRSIVDDQTDLICRYDTQLRLTFVNRAFAQFHHKSPQEMIGQPLLDFIPPSDHEIIIANAKSQSLEHPVTSIERPIMSPDKTLRWFQWTDRALLDDTGKIVEYQVVGRDITERQQAQSELQALYEATSSLLTVDKLRTLSRQLVDTVVRVFDQSDCGLMLFDRQTQQITRLARTGKYDIHPDLPLLIDGVGLVPQAIRTGKTVYAANVTLEPNYLPSESRTHSELVVPLKTAQGQVIGALDLQSAEVNAFSERDQRILTAYAERAAVAIENIQLYEAIHWHAEELEHQVQQRTAELQTSKNGVEAILNNSADAILLIDTHLNIQQTNSSFHQLFRCATNSCFTQSLVSLIHPEDTQRVHDLAQATLVQQDRKLVEVRAIRRDETFFNAELSLGAIKDTGLVCVIRDITERKAQEEQLRYYASFQKHIIDAVLTTDINFCIQSWNRAAEAIYGWTAEEVIGRRAHEIFKTQFQPDENREHALETLRQFDRWQGEVRQQHKDGRWLDISSSISQLMDENGTVIGTVAVNRDITERKQIQQSVIESEARYRLLAENISDIIIKTNSAGIRTFITPSCYPLGGYTPDELIGQPSIEVIHPDDRPAAISAVQQAYQSGKTSYSLTQRVRHKEGHYIWIEITNNLVYEPTTGNLVEMIGVARDITERKRAEEALQSNIAKDHLFQSYLKALHEITIELTQIDDLDTFYKRTVEFGLAELGFERLALFLYNEEDQSAQGTYGTDADGQVVAEHHLRFVPSPEGVMGRARVQTERFYIDENVPLLDTYRYETGSIGWNAAAILWNGTRNLGWLVADNLLSGKPVSKSLLDIIGLYALAVGTLLVQKRAQLALRESETLHRLVTENINDMVLRSTLAGECLYVSPSVQHLLGYTPEEWINLRHFDLVHPADQALVWEAYASTVPLGKPIAPYIHRVRHKKGHYVWLETVGQPFFDATTGNPEGIVTSTRDITERKQAEEALRASEEKYRHLVDNMRGGFAIYDSEDRFTYINERFSEILGYSREEILGRSSFDYLDMTNADILHNQLQQRRQAKNTSYELVVRRKDGTQVYLLVSGSPMFDQNGTYTGSFAVITDITLQKQSEEVLRQALAKEKELGELKTRFVSMASHEFRTPLAAILAIVETLSIYRHKLSDEQVNQRFDKIKEQIAHLKDIMEDVLTMTRLQARRVELHPVNLDLDAVIRSVLEEFQGRADVGHPLEYSVSGTIREQVGDHKLLRQIISNLISNAIKYSPESSPIALELEYTDAAVVLKVRDHGIGIPAADLPHLFEPFHRAANVGAISGTGLGLVIAKEAVEMHGGSIAVDSQPGVETTFTIRFPNNDE